MTHQNQSVTTHCISTNLNTIGVLAKAVAKNPFDDCEISKRRKTQITLILNQLSAGRRGIQKKSYLIITQKCFNIQLILEWLWHLNFRYSLCEEGNIFTWKFNMLVTSHFFSSDSSKFPSVEDLLLLPGSQVWAQTYQCFKINTRILIFFDETRLEMFSK